MTHLVLKRILMKVILMLSDTVASIMMQKQILYISEQEIMILRSVDLFHVTALAAVLLIH